jgi:hypothetical protein
LKFDRSRLQVKAGSKIKLLFNNNDDMTHNFVLVMPGTAKEVGDMAFNMGLKGPELNYIPRTPKYCTTPGCCNRMRQNLFISLHRQNRELTPTYVHIRATPW